MTPEQFFPFAVGILCVCASGMYVINGNWKMAVIWACWAIADVVIALL